MEIAAGLDEKQRLFDEATEVECGGDVSGGTRVSVQVESIMLYELLFKGVPHVSGGSASDDHALARGVKNSTMSSIRGGAIIPHQGVICLIGEDAAVRDSFAALLQAHGYGVIAEARHDRPPILPMNGVFCVVLDPHCEGQDEATVIAETRAAFPDLPMIAISHGLGRPLSPAARVESVLDKPLAPERLLAAVRRFRALAIGGTP